MLQIIQVDPATVHALEGIQIDLPAVAYIGIDDGEIVGSGGLAWGAGRCWVWLMLEHGKPSYALTIARRFRRLTQKAAQLGENAVFTPRDAKFKTSERLLTMLGFKFYGMEHGQEVWKWQL